jgi:peptidoglycan/xylan/chitin deacetylase (PgdA/CDA1 family)
MMVTSRAPRTTLRSATSTVGVLAGVGVAHALPSALLLGSFTSRWHAPALGDGRCDHVAITFDDGPDPATTPATLAALDRLGWKATFFLLGTQVEAAPGLAATIAAAGHEVAVHGYRHRSHLLRTPFDVVADVQRAVDAITEATDQRPAWLRPPYGHVSTGTVVAARRAHLQLVLWTTWGREWVEGSTPSTVAAQLTNRLRGGGTVLLHDSDCTSPVGSAALATAALPQLADHLAAHGLTAGPLRDHGLRGPSAVSPDRTRPEVTA